MIRVSPSETLRITSINLLRSYSLSEPTPELKEAIELLKHRQYLTPEAKISCESPFASLYRHVFFVQSISSRISESFSYSVLRYVSLSPFLVRTAFEKKWKTLTITLKSFFFPSRFIHRERMLLSIMSSAGT